MKKHLAATFALLVIATISNAQLYLGGSVNFQTGNSSLDDDTKTSLSNLRITPTVGYYLNERFDIGLDLHLRSSTSENTENTEIKNTEWSVAPFARYSFIQFGKFEVIGKLGVRVGGGKDENTNPDDPTNDFSQKYTLWGVNLSPIVAYSVTKNIILYTQLNFASLGYYSSKYQGDNAMHYFNVGVDSNNIANTGDLEIGFIYKF